MKLPLESEDPAILKQMPNTTYVRGAGGTKEIKITRAKVQRIADAFFGPGTLVRRKAKTEPGFRKQIAVKKGRKYVVVGSGDDWLDVINQTALYYEKYDLCGEIGQLKEAIRKAKWEQQNASSNEQLTKQQNATPTSTASEPSSLKAE